MQYLLLIYTNEADDLARPEAEQNDIIQRYFSFTQDIVSSGHFKAGDALQPTDTATTVRVRNGDVMTTDGPFAETKEQLGGYYLIEAADLDEATQIAARIPSADHGSVEIRPIMVFED
ncbi:MAG: YciI family protein [Pseudomonadota bacterium]